MGLSTPRVHFIPMSDSIKVWPVGLVVDQKVEIQNK
jgi:hypothetical protein